MTDRRILPGACMLLVGILWATWPDAGWWRLCALSALAVALLVARREWRWALIALAGASAMSLPLLGGSLMDWRVWTTALLLIPTLDSLLAPPLRDPDSAWLSTLLVVAVLAAAGVVLALWRPSHDAIFAPDGLLSSILLVAAATSVLAILLAAKSAPEG